MLKGICKCGAILTEQNCSPSVFRRSHGAKSKSSGSPWCNSCLNKRNRLSREMYPKRYMFSSIKSRCKTVTGMEFTIELKDIPDFPEYCPVFPWIKLDCRTGKGTNRDSSPSLDRIDNLKGYIPGNIRVISFRANYMKGNAELRELLALAKDAKNPKLNLAVKYKKIKLPIESVVEGRLIWDKLNQTWLHPETLQPVA